MKYFLAKDDALEKDLWMNCWITKVGAKGLPFYFNIYSKQSQWKKPANYEPDIEAPYTRKRLNNYWYLIITNRDRSFYWNKKTKESCCQVPPELLEVSQEIGNKVPQDFIKQDEMAIREQKQPDRSAFLDHLSTLPITQFTAWESIAGKCKDIALSLSTMEKRKLFENYCKSLPAACTLNPLEYFVNEFLPKHVQDRKVLWKQIEMKMKQDSCLRMIKGPKPEYELAFKNYLKRFYS